MNPPNEAAALKECWRVAHTRPRCEKKVAAACERDGIPTTLPVYRSVKKYRGKAVEFQKPLFPGYLFFRADHNQSTLVLNHQQVARVLVPTDQAEFEAQLTNILRALETQREIRLAPQVVDGVRVRIKYGPLRGMEGFVERRKGPLEVFLRLDFIAQAAAVQVSADEVEPV